MLQFCRRLLVQLIIFIGTFSLQLIGAIILVPITNFYQIGSLPYILCWFDSAVPYYNQDPTAINLVNAEGYLARYCYLAWRNPLNYFNYKYLGFIWNTPTNLSIIGSTNVGDNTGSIPGYKHIECTVNNSSYYEYYYVYKYSTNYCFYFRMGYAIGNPATDQIGQVQRQVFEFNPIHSYSGV